MKRAPSQSSGSILGTRDLKQLLREGALLAAGPLATGLYGAVRYGAGSPQSRTLAFGSLVTAQLLHAISCRSTQQGIFGPGDLQPNPYLDRTLMVSGAAQAAALLIPRLRQLMGIAPLDPTSILIGTVAGVAPFLIREMQKAVMQTPIPVSPLPSLPETRPQSDFSPAIQQHASAPFQTGMRRPAAES
jgi:Ca2+-transporting ATPase